MADIIVQSYLEDPLSYILEAIDSTRGVETSPIHMTPMGKADGEEIDSTKSVLFKSKIHVDKNRRSQVRDEIVEYLNKLLDKTTTLPFSEVIAGTAKKPDADQFDVVVKETDKGKGQVIRILVKPTNAGGSGGGAAKTKIQEVGQAVFIAIRYQKNKPLICHPKNPRDCLTTKDYEEGMKDVDGPGVKIEEIESLEQKWKDSFILGANVVAAKVKGSEWKFVRGDNKVEDAISNAFKRVKKNSPGTPENEDKWNPSDIWMVKDKNKVVTELNKENTIDCLNNFFNQAFSTAPIKNDSGKDVEPRSLIGLSLKKLGASARLDIMNEVGKTQLQKAGKVTFRKAASLKELTALSGMDVYFVILPGGNKQQGSFQARNFGGKNKGQWQFELKGVTAAQGKVKGEVARKLLKAAEFKNIPDEPTFAECKPDATKADKITIEIYDFMNVLNPKPQGWDKIKKRARMTKEETIMAEIASQETSWRFSKLAGLRFLAWLNKLGNGEADRAMKELYLYASSQTDKSSVYYKLY